MSLSISRDSSFFCRNIHIAPPSADEGFIKIHVDIGKDTSTEELSALIVQIPEFQWASGCPNFYDRTVLHKAAVENNSVLISYIVKEGGSDLLELAESYHKATPLWNAVYSCNHQAVKTLIALVDPDLGLSHQPGPIPVSFSVVNFQ